MMLPRETNKQQGYSLIELLVSMVIALIVLAGVTQTMIDNKKKFKFNDQISLIQENARYAVEKMSYELRMAGYQGCSKETAIANSIIGAAASDFYSGVGVEGWDSTEATTEFPVAYRADLWSFGSGSLTDPDSFIVRYVNTDTNFYVTNHVDTSATITVGTHGIKTGQILSVANPSCTQVGIFQHVGSNPIKFVHNTGSSVIPGNCTKMLGGDFDCSDTSSAFSYTYPDGSTVSEFSSSAYYIAASSVDASIPALYRETLGVDASSNMTTQPMELLIGVENMQVLYGVDTDATADGMANQYVTADLITGVGVMIWDKVVSVKLNLLLRSIDPVWDEDMTFTFNGEDYTDRFLRQRVSTTVQLRNLALVE